MALSTVLYQARTVDTHFCEKIAAQVVLQAAGYPFL